MIKLFTNNAFFTPKPEVNKL